MWSTTNEHTVLGEVALGINWCVGLRHDELFFGVSSQVDDLVGDPTVHDLAVGRLNEAVLVDSCVGGQGTNEANVWTFWRLNRTHTAVVGGVNVSNFETGTLTGKTTRSKGRQTTLVGKASKWVDLVHELTQLARSEELLSCSHDRADVDERLWGDGFDVLGRHALTNHALHARKANTELVLDELTN